MSAENQFFPENQESGNYEMVENKASRNICILRDGITPDDLARELTGKLGKYDANGSIYITHLDGIVEKHLKWKQILPRVHIHYAVKCNNDDLILRMLKQLGVGFECASQLEVEHVLSIGVKPDDIIIGNPVRTGPFLRYLATHGVNILHVESEGEMVKIKELHPGARLLLRVLILPSDSSDTMSYVGNGIRFGSHMDDSKHLLIKAKELGLDVIGMTYRLCEGSADPSVHADTIEKVAHLFGVARELGFDLSLLDFCGGIPYEPDQIKKVGAALTEALDIYFPSGSGVTVVAEPGRYFAASLGSVYMNILDMREKKTLVRRYEDLNKGPDPEMMNGMNLCLHRLRCDGVPEAMYVCNQSVYQLFSDNKQRTIEPLKPESCESRCARSIIYGLSCYGGDVLAHSVDLPKMAIGDWLVARDIGQYAKVCGTPFNGLPEYTEIVAVSEKYRTMLDEELHGLQK